VADRAMLLREYVAGFDLLGLQDPLPKLQAWLDESIRGSQSTIHGDLNLENVLVGPGAFVWLIDFAQTRDGHVLYDFAHLEAQVIAHVIARQVNTPDDYLQLLRANDHPLLVALHDIAASCLTNPAQPREYTLALCLACAGGLKFNNLQPFPKHLLYLTAAYLGQTL
jgi:Ternary complex associated domain 9